MLVSSQTKPAGGGKIVLDSSANNRDYKNVHFTKAVGENRYDIIATLDQWLSCNLTYFKLTAPTCPQVGQAGLLRTEIGVEFF